jgi:mannose-6-phosphate isomerase class I
LESSNFDKFPEVKINGEKGWQGWKAIADHLLPEVKELLKAGKKKKLIVALECYHGVSVPEVMDKLRANLAGAIASAGGRPTMHFFNAGDTFLDEQAIQTMVYPYVTDDPVFGYITSLSLSDFLDKEKIAVMRQSIDRIESGITWVCGSGAALIVPDADLLIYADMPRWEIQLRFRRNEVSNLGADNPQDVFSYQYKRAFFVDWRVCDRHKTSLMDRWDYVLDTTIPGNPKMIRGKALLLALQEVVKRPFRVVPFFDPGPWGGQWLKEVCDLERSEKNIAWGFDCVPEENSLLLRFDNIVFETPSINLVFRQPAQLLGDKVYDAFGAEFPIRFDFLDTMEGGNLSLQVHPLKAYIREKFGMAYTQDESYYFLQAKEEAFVYLGLKDDIVPADMIRDLEKAQQSGLFDAEKYVEKWPIRQHDHALIPAGTIHCSGANSVVLEISATPYIFTFKLWDWGRMGLDGKPRPISLEHGKQVIQWDRTRQWTGEHLLNKISPVAEGEGWKEERTGLDETSFIETRRHWFTGTVPHDTGSVVNILNLIEGREAIVESPTAAFEPFIVHYAETFIVPAGVGPYTVRPHGESIGRRCATIKAYVRTENLSDYRINGANGGPGTADQSQKAMGTTNGESGPTDRSPGTTNP